MVGVRAHRYAVRVHPAILPTSEVWRRIPVVGPRTVRAVVTAAAFTAVSQRTDRDPREFTATEGRSGTHGAPSSRWESTCPGCGSAGYGPRCRRAMPGPVHGSTRRKKGSGSTFCSRRVRAPAIGCQEAGWSSRATVRCSTSCEGGRSLDLGDQVELVGHVGGEQAALLRRGRRARRAFDRLVHRRRRGLPVSLLEGLAWARSASRPHRAARTRFSRRDATGSWCRVPTSGALAARLVEAALRCTRHARSCRPRRAQGAGVRMVGRRPPPARTVARRGAAE